MIKYFDINKDKDNIRCKLYFNKNDNINKLVLYSHGFAGHKDNKTCEKFSERILSKYKNIAILCFDLPSHGDDVKKRVTLVDCIRYLDTIINYIKDNMNINDIYSYSTSFGSYLVLLYIQKFNNPFKKLILRCPAINMYESIIKNVIKNDELEKLNKNKDVLVGFDNKVNINIDFLNELKDNDIRKYDYLKYAENMLIIQGDNDEIISYDLVYMFADNNYIDFYKVEGANHRFHNQLHMEIANKKILESFNF